jgi:hypothetical protein
MMHDITEFAYLWDGSSPSWALLHINSHKEEENPRYLIINTETREALLIKDDNLYEKVQERMLRERVRIVSVGNGYY